MFGLKVQLLKNSAKDTYSTTDFWNFEQLLIFWMTTQTVYNFSVDQILWAIVVWAIDYFPFGCAENMSLAQILYSFNIFSFEILF